jgi:FkbM family methyltransferase
MRLRSHTPLWRRLLRQAGRRLFRLAENNDEWRFGRNGEQWLLRELLQDHVRSGAVRPFVVFDAGANVGDYTHAVLRAARTAGCAVEVHVFEPSPRCLQVLRQSFAGDPQVRIVAGALASAKGEAVLYDGGLGSTLASLVPRDVLTGKAGAEVTVPLLRLGDYLAEQGIARVDLLKLDVEGSELAALHGLGERLRPENVGLIQFEYGGSTLDARATLRDFYALLGAQGYRVAKLFPNALEVRPYDVWMEHYAYANYVALPASAPL